MGKIRRWFRSYLEDHALSVHLDSKSTEPWRVTCRMPHGSVLGPILFTLYTADIGNFIRAHQLLHHCYSDDVHVLGSCKLDEGNSLNTNVLECMQSSQLGWPEINLNRIQQSLNLWCTTARRLQVFKDSQLNIFHLPDDGGVAEKSWRVLRSVTYDECPHQSSGTCVHFSA